MNSASSWIAFLIDTVTAALSGTRTRLSMQIYFWVRADRLGKGKALAQ
jgi:hypothetical protein